MRAYLPAAGKFYFSGITLYPEQELYKEVSFLSYYYHWDYKTVMTLDHQTRRRGCAEISAIHKELNQTPKNIFEV